VLRRCRCASSDRFLAKKRPQSRSGWGARLCLLGGGKRHRLAVEMHQACQLAYAAASN
jgi:hypothetical protein